MTSNKIFFTGLLLQTLVAGAQIRDTTAISSQSTAPAVSSAPGEGKERAFQLTFVTPLGTNGIESFKITNRFSLNVIAGVARGLEGFEAGGVANIILKDVTGVQMAGFTNVVLGNVKGAQFAGYFNYSGGNFRGASFAGMCNVNLGDLEGGQFSGFCNFNRKGVRGVQVAGYSNITLGNLKGTQVSAFANIAKGNVEGSQICGFVNYAKKVKGLQLGIINISDSVDGVSIGLFNFVRKGVHQLEVSADELFYANLAYRTGSASFHNIFSVGLQPGTKNLWQFGYGAGTSFRIKNDWYSDLNVTAHHVSSGSFYWGTSELYRAYWGVEHKFGKKFSVAAGPTLNIYVSDTYDPDYAKVYKRVSPYGGEGSTSRYGFNTRVWVGGRIALRFF
jgi:hypothetical protein